jgi:hypothetical protein
MIDVEHAIAVEKRGRARLFVGGFSHDVGTKDNRARGQKYTLAACATPRRGLKAAQSSPDAATTVM